MKERGNENKWARTEPLGNCLGIANGAKGDQERKW